MTVPALMPSAADLRDFPAMMLDVVRLRDADLTLISTGDEFKAAVLLWAASWHQTPAASLPDDERVLAGLARLSPRAWAKIRHTAMRGWTLCADGRLYHAVIAEKALECWIEKLNARISSGAGNAKRYGYTFDRAPLDADLDEAARLLHQLNPKSRALLKAKRQPQNEGAGDGSGQAPGGTPGGMPLGSQGKGREGITLPEGAVAANETPDQEAWRRAKALLSRAGRMSEVKAGGLFGKILRDNRLEARDMLPSVVKAETLGTEDPQGYLVAAAKGIASRSPNRLAPTAVDVSSWDEDTWAAAVTHYRQDGSWSPTMGPEPGKPGCLVPANLLLKVATQ